MTPRAGLSSGTKDNRRVDVAAEIKHRKTNKGNGDALVTTEDQRALEIFNGEIAIPRSLFVESRTLTDF